MSDLVYTELFVGTLKILNHEILMIDCCSIDKARVQQRKENCLFCHIAYNQIYYSQLLFPDPRMLHVPLGVQVLVNNHGVKVVYEPLCPMEPICTWRSFRY